MDTERPPPMGAGTPTRLSGGRLLAEITNQIVSLAREHYGRGPIRAKTYVIDDAIVCVMRDGLIQIERTMAEAGEEDKVLELRRDFQGMMREHYSKMVESLTGRQVRAFLSQTHLDPDLTVEIFFLDGPVPGFGTLEIVNLD